MKNNESGAESMVRDRGIKRGEKKNKRGKKTLRNVRTITR